MRDTIIKWGVPLVVFLLPWQTRYIFGEAAIGFVPTGSEFLVLSLYVTEVVLIIVALLRGRPQFTEKTRRIVYFMGPIFLVAGLSIHDAIDRGLALHAFFHLLMAGLLFIELVDSRTEPRLVIAALCLGLVVPAVLGLGQTIFGGSPSSTLLGLATRDHDRLGEAVVEIDSYRLERAYGSFPHPNIFGGYLAVAVIGALWMAKRSRSLIALLTLALIATFFRSAVIGLILAGALSWRRGLITIIPLMIIVGPLLFFRGDLSSALESRSITERIEQVRQWPAVVDDHWFLGRGIGNYVPAHMLAFDVVEDHERGVSRVEWWMHQPVHNVPLLVTVEIGLIGLISLIGFIAAIDRLNFSRFPNREALIAFAMGNTLLVIAMFDHYLWSMWPGLALAAIVLALTVRLGEEAY